MASYRICSKIKVFFKKVKIMFDKSSRKMFSTCVSKMKSEMEIQQDAVTFWLEKNQTRVNPHDTKPNIIKACAQWYG